MKHLCFCHPLRGFLPKGLFSWRLSFILPPFLLLAIFTSLFFFGQASRALADNTITVDAAQNLGEINPLFFGQNVMFDCNTMWDHRTDTLRTEADNSYVFVKNRIEELAPTILRFPGGIGSDVHIWEDGLGLQTTNQLNPGQTEIVLNESPQSWRLPDNPNDPYELKGLIIDLAPINPFQENLMGQLGDRFNYTGVDTVNNKLTGITNPGAAITITHPPGTRVRIGGRPILDPKRNNDISQYNNWTNTYGIIEHLKLVNFLGAQALLTVNYSTGLDSTGTITTNASLSQRILRAQALVAFCNGLTGDIRSLEFNGSSTDGEGRDWGTVGYWAGKRAALGYPDPFNVTYWEVGNELCSSSETGHTTASDYADKFKQFAKKMKIIDSTIKVGAVGLNLPTYHGDYPGDTDPWNGTVVDNTKNDLDFLSIHPYYPASYTPPDYNSDSWFKLIMAGAIQARNDLVAIRGIIDGISPGRYIGLALTEYGFLIPNGEARYHSNLARALHDADLLMSLIKKEGSATKLGILAATNWNLHALNPDAAIGYQWPGLPNNNLSWTDSGLRTIRPQYYALKMLRQSLAGRQLVQTQVLSSPTFSIDAKVGNIEPNPAVPCLEAIAALSYNGRSLTLAVINRSLDSFPNSTITATVQLSNLFFAPKSATGTKLTSVNPGDNNEAGEVVKPSGPVTYAPVPQSFTFEPHSLTIIEFRSTNLCPIINLLMLND